MKDGMKSDEMWMGSSFCDTFSGNSLMVGATIAAAEIEAGTITHALLAENIIGSENILANNVLTAAIAAANVTAAKMATNSVLSGNILAGNILTAAIANDAVTLVKIPANAIDADTTNLEAGSKVVVFRTAFAAPPFVTAQFLNNGRTAALTTNNEWIGVGSIAPGSFFAVGSPGGYAFNWMAIGSR